MKKIKLFLLLIATAVITPAAAQMPELPIDPAVKIGKLDNGLTYYIRHNEEPKNQANFYIAQKVGSVQEEESQRGLAHFLEHMAFNGSEHFPGNSLIKYCERIGVKFGQNLNAYTSTDETVYNIDDVPTTDITNVDSCLLILSDWSGRLNLESEEIDKERGVIHEEWRMRTSANMRILNRQLPKLYPGSRYGERMPIGLMSVIDNFSPEFLRDYYHKWYHPSLQGIVVVGDVDVDYVESKIKEYFSDIKNPVPEAPYEYYPVPDNAEPIYCIDKDKEQAQIVTEMFFKHEPLPAELRGTPMLLVQDGLNAVITSVLNQRLEELSQSADCPFVASGSSDDNYLISKTCDAFTIYMLPKPGRDTEAVKTVMTEVARARQHGFTATEIQRAKDEYLSNLEKIYDNRTKQKNSFYCPQYVRHFLEGNAIPDIETEFQYTKMLLQQLPDEAYNATFSEYTANIDTNFVFIAFYPEKDDVVIPSDAAFRAAVEEGFRAQTEAYVDEVNNDPLISDLPKPVKVGEATESDFGYSKWTLKNGANVYYKKTDFNDSQVIFVARSKGGTSKLPESDVFNAELFANVMESTGIGSFTGTELSKKMAGKQVSCKVALGENVDIISGNSTPKDLRTLFELLYLRFQEPSNDVDGYNNLIGIYRSQLENAEKNPMIAFSDSVKQTIYCHSPRHQQLKLSSLDKVSYERIRQIYRERFQSAGDFDFYFTGAFDEDSLRIFTEQYIAPLKGLKKREEYTDLGDLMCKGKVENRFSRDMETPQANIIVFWNGEAEYTMKQSLVVSALGNVLSERYLKTIREDGGMSYSVGAYADLSFGLHDQYIMQVYCPVKPAMMDEALALMQKGIEEIAKDGVTEEELKKFKEFELKEYADQQRSNNYWQELITSKVNFGKDLQTGYEECVKSLTSDDVKAFVNDVLLKQFNRAIITILPTDFSEEDK